MSEQNCGLPEVGEYYRALVESLDASLCRWLPDFTLTYANEKYRRIFCISGEAVGLNWIGLLPQEARSSTVDFYQEAMKTLRTVTYEHAVSVEGGEERYYHWTDTPILDKTGKLVEYQSVGIDITDRKRAEQVQVENEARMKELLEATPDAMVIVDEKGRIVLVNARAKAVFGYSRHELIGMSVDLLLPESMRNIHVQNRNTFMRYPRIAIAGVDREIRALRKNGELFPAEVSLSHHVMANGESVVICAIRDVTEKNRSAALIAAQRDLAQLASADLSLSEEKLWELCLDRVMKVSESDAGGFYLYEEESGSFSLSGHRGFGADFVAAVARIDGNLPTSKALVAGRMVILNHEELRKRENVASEGLHWAAIVPVAQRGRILGCLNIASHRSSSVAEWSAQTLETLALEIANIIVRRRTELALEAETFRRRILFEESPDGILIVDPATSGFLEFNSTAHTQLGYTREEFAKLHIYDVEASETADQTLEHIQEVIRNGKSDFETLQRSKSGEIRNIHVTAQIVQILSQPVYYCIWRDVTERKSIEENLRESRQRIEMAVRGANAGMWDWNIKTGETVFNERWAGMLGYSLAELQPVSIQTWFDLLHPDDRAISDQRIAFHLEGKTEYYECEVRMRHKSGSWVWVLDHGKVLELDEDGSPLRMFGTHLDITRSKRDELRTRARLRLATFAEEVSDSRSLMRAMLDEAEELTGSRIGFFHFVDDTQETIQLQAWSTRTIEERCTADTEGCHYKLGSAGVWAESIRTGKDFVCQDMTSQPGRHGMPEGHAPVTRFVSLPIFRDGAIVAVVGLGNKPSDYDEADLDSIRTLAEYTYDVVMRIQAENALKASEEQLRGLMASLDNAICTIDRAGTVLYVNDRATVLLNRTAPQECLGKNLRDLLTEDLASQSRSVVEDVFDKDHESVFELQVPIGSRLRWHRISAQPLHDAGRVSRVLVNAMDIHDLKTAQEDLENLNRTLEEKVDWRTAELRDLYDKAPTGYHSLDSEGVYVMVNETEATWLGYSKEEILGHPILEFMSPESSTRFREYFPTFIAQGWLQDLEFELHRKDGSLMLVSISATALYDDSGRFIMSRSTMVDITARKQAEIEIKRNANFISALLDSIPTPVFYKDRDGRYLGCNRAFSEVLGKSAEEIVGKLPEEIWYQQQATLYRSKDLDLFRHEEHQSYEGTIMDREGMTRPVIFVKNVFLDEKGERSGLVGAFIDITERKKTEETLRKANEALEKAMRMKDEFLATMSHELRTPLTGILGLSEALQLETYGRLTDRQLKTVKTIENSGRHLLTLINDVLDLSKIEAGKLTLDMVRSSLEDICQSSLQLTKGMAHQKHQHVGYSAPIDPVYMDIDPRRIKQVVVNLLSNAIKFTPDGGKLGLTVEPDQENRQIRISVWDKGIGIKPEHISRLFKPFTQIDGSLSRQYSGTGLGLALVRKLVEMHGGSVEVESIFGEGSRFTIVLPWNIERPRVLDPVETPPSVDGRVDSDPDPEAPLILIVDDNDTLLTMMCDFLEVQGFRTAMCASGREVLEKIDDIKPDIVLMDIQMPGMDGFETITRIRASRDARVASSYIIAVTALAMPGDRERCLDAGANDYISKPVKLGELGERLRQLTRD